MEDFTLRASPLIIAAAVNESGGRSTMLGEQWPEKGG
jgi:hypothetical protein